MLRALVAAALFAGAGCVGAVGASDAQSTADAGRTDDLQTGASTGARPETRTLVDPAVRAAEAAVAPWPAEAPSIKKGLYAGSWTVDETHPFEHAWFDEAGLRETYTKRAAGRRTWAGMSTTSEAAPLDALLRDRTGPASACLYTLVTRSPVEGTDPYDPASYETLDAVLHVRHRGRLRAWYDGRLVIDAPAPPPGEIAHARAAVTLTGAFDVLLLKVGRGSPELGESFDIDARLGLPDGSPVPLQGWNTMRPSSFLNDLHPVEVAPDSDG